MAKDPGLGYRVTAAVTGVKGSCNAGHAVGESFELSCHNPGGLCGFFYHDIFPALSLMQFNGAYPWDAPGQTTVRCCDKNVNLTMVIRKQGT